MLVVRDVAEMRSILDRVRASGRSVGFVPTMGALHGGHESLMRAAAEHDDVATASLFVNPLQFAPDEDLDSYPASFDRDLDIAERCGVSYLFAPSASEMYPDGCWTTVTLAIVTDKWEGANRPTHFDGVATVVTKLFNIIGPCRAYFGEKDFQQLAMLRRMVADLNQPIEVVGLPTIRESDGLAMSSRNRRLTAEQRRDAPIVNEALRAGAAAIDAGETDPEAVAEIIRGVLSTAATAQAPDYVAVVDSSSLTVPSTLRGDIRLLTAVRFGDVRLIDNIGVSAP